MKENKKEENIEKKIEENKEELNKQRKNNKRIIIYLILIVLIIIIADVIFVVITKNKNNEKGNIEIEYISNNINDSNDINNINNEEIDENEVYTVTAKADVNYSENFNKQFNKYFGSISGDKVIELLEIISSNNKVNLTNNVSVNASFSTDVCSALYLEKEMDPNNIFSIRNYIDINRNYSISGISYTEEGYLNGISISE